MGTSLPELVTTITAIVKKQAALSVGNILGANIMDLTMIMPLCALVSGKALPISPASARLDLPACLLVGLVAVGEVLPLAGTAPPGHLCRVPLPHLLRGGVRGLRKKVLDFDQTPSARLSL